MKEKSLKQGLTISKDLTVELTQDISPMRTVRTKQENETGTRIIAKDEQDICDKGTWA